MKYKNIIFAISSLLLISCTAKIDDNNEKISTNNIYEYNIIIDKTTYDKDTFLIDKGNLDSIIYEPCQARQQNVIDAINNSNPGDIYKITSDNKIVIYESFPSQFGIMNDQVKIDKVSEGIYHSFTLNDDYSLTSKNDNKKYEPSTFGRYDTQTYDKIHSLSFDAYTFYVFNKDGSKTRLVDLNANTTLYGYTAQNMEYVFGLYSYDVSTK